MLNVEQMKVKFNEHWNKLDANTKRYLQDFICEIDRDFYLVEEDLVKLNLLHLRLRCKMRDLENRTKEVSKIVGYSSLLDDAKDFDKNIIQDNPAQSQQFIETAQAFGLGESGCDVNHPETQAKK